MAKPSLFDNLTPEEQAELLALVEYCGRSVRFEFGGLQAIFLNETRRQRLIELHNKIRPPYNLVGGKEVRTPPNE